MSKSGQSGPGMTLEHLREEIVGIDAEVPILGGEHRRYVFLDNAASTPALRGVLQAVEQFLPWYSGVHRGTGFKSLLSTEVFDAAHDTVGRFVGADLRTNTVIFLKNTTEAINKLANRTRLRRDDLVLTSVMEHHSNDLPWRRHATVHHVGVTHDGRLDLSALQRLLRDHAGRVKIVAIHGASNITGLCAPIHEIAELVHRAGALLFVDAAQLAAHRSIDMLPDDDPGHLDFLALSAHKMYAPFGTGALVGPRAFFEDGEPDVVGGGVVEIVTLEDAVWNRPPQKEEAGSPNVLGGVALAAAVRILRTVGMETIANHEHHLMEYAYGKLLAMRGITLYGPLENLAEKVGVIPFNVTDVHHALTAAIMGTEGGIGVRNGCFCAHPYVKELLGVGPEEDRILTSEVLAGNKSRLPGMVRASLGCYNNETDVDAMVEMLERIVRRDYDGRYVQNTATGAFHAEGFAPDFRAYVPFDEPTTPAESRMASEAS